MAIITDPNINNIDTQDWAMSLDDSGAVVTRVDEINQSIRVILNTEIGSDPFRPEFGCNVLFYIDRPIDEATAGLRAETLRALRRWEPRITVEAITIRLENTQIFISVTWRDARTAEQRTTETQIAA